MNRTGIVLLVGLLFAVAGGAAAGPLDLDVLKADPDPSMALAFAAVVPGGGHYYLAAYEPNQAGYGTMYLASTLATAIAAVAFAANGDGVKAAGCGVFFLSFRFWDFKTSVQDARTIREQRFAAAHP